MNKNYEAEYHVAEDTNWWFVARRDAIRLLLEKYKVPKTAALLDIGCGGGALEVYLQRLGYSNLHALDFSAEAVAMCHNRGVANAYQMDAHKPEFPDASFDVLVASDSLEHLERDDDALRAWLRLLKPGGIGLFFVPAHPSLWSQHDVVNHHYRRYTFDGFKSQLQQTGFDVLESGPWNGLIYLPTALVRAWSRRRQAAPKPEASDLVQLPGLINQLLVGYLRVENRLFARRRLPFGVSAYAVVRKPQVGAL